MTKNIILATDGYKLGHRDQYPKGTEVVYSNFTARSCGYYPEACDGYVVAGIQLFISKYLIDDFNSGFFARSKSDVSEKYKNRINSFLGSDNIVGANHIEELHDLGYLPIKIKALPEGTLCPIGVPCMTIVNTHDRFYWLTNYLETLISCTLWLPMTSATTARLFKKSLLSHASRTSWSDNERLNIPFLCHDFSMRGMAGMDAAVLSGMGHLFSFTGSETIPAIEAAEEYYSKDDNLIAATIPATEHSVMCAGSKDSEFDTFRRLITETYPKGFVSIVSDTWDYWKVITEYLPALKSEIMARDGRFVVRPDSGDPVDIICGREFAGSDTPEGKGTYQLLWEIFGGTVNEAGYKVLDSHIGIIYGDSITLERQADIYSKLEAKGFAATNLVLGIGSYTYQGKTRDSLGFAVKSTWCKINGVDTEIFKDPKTDNGVKKSLKGLICVQQDDNKLIAVDQCSHTDEAKGALKTVFSNGVAHNTTSLTEIRNTVNDSL